MCNLLSVLLLMLFVAPMAVAGEWTDASDGMSLRSFPGAEGFGARTVGGRGGKILCVATVADTGNGSLREAAERDDARVIVFKTGGTIHLKSRLYFGPNVTVLGQTAPGDGIAISGRVNVGSNTILRGVRFRGTATHDGSDTLGLERYAKNVIIDHVSVSWGRDETLVVMNVQPGVKNITFQWNMVSEGVDPGNGKWLGKGLQVTNFGTNVSIHHNLLTRFKDRRPLLKTEFHGELINNVSDGPAGIQYRLDNLKNSNNKPSADSRLLVNVLGNYYKSDHVANVYAKSDPYPKGSAIYAKGNWYYKRKHDSASDWVAFNFLRGTENLEKSSSPVYPLSDVTIHPAQEAYDLVLTNAGAIVPRRDSVDLRQITHIKEGGKSKPVRSISSVGGLPELARGTPPADTDGGGLPDAYEQKHGLDPHNPGDDNSFHRSGYMYIESWANSLIPLLTAPTEPDQVSRRRKCLCGFETDGTRRTRHK